MNTEGQTPLYVAELLWERHFAGRVPRDAIILEPTCGRGAFLRAIPPGIAAFGIERDADLAQQARQLSGRPVITGDIATAEVTTPPTHILGNPPFRRALLLQLLARARAWLPEEDGGRAGLILAAEMLSTPATVEQLARDWWIEQELLPRTLFHKMRTPILFVQFIRRGPRSAGRLHGFGLVGEALAFRDLPRAVKQLLTDNPAPPWRAIAAEALHQLGATRRRPASLPEIYAAVEGSRAARGKMQGNRFWQPKIRQVLQLHPEFEPAGRGAWALANMKSEAA